MIHFPDNTIYIECRGGEKKKLTFESIGDVPEIIKIKGSCGCLKGTFDKSSGILHVNYNVSAVPKHLIDTQGYYNSRKSIIIEYKSGSVEILYIEAKVYK